VSGAAQPPDLSAHLDAAERAAASTVAALQSALAAVPDDAIWSSLRASLVERIALAGRAGDPTRERALLAEMARPKGPTVSLEHVSDRGVEDRGIKAEVIRRTATQVFCRSYGREEVYRLTDGEPVGVVKSHATRIRGFRTTASRTRIRAADLHLVLALPVGRNDVSRALDALYPPPALTPKEKAK